MRIESDTNLPSWKKLKMFIYWKRNLKRPTARYDNSRRLCPNGLSARAGSGGKFRKSSIKSGIAGHYHNMILQSKYKKCPASASVVCCDLL